MSPELKERIKKIVTPDTPFGPIDSVNIKDSEVAASLFDPHNTSFNSLLRKDVSVVIGRRGSGKTALLKSYKYRRYLDPGDYLPGNSEKLDVEDYDIVIEIVAHAQFVEMQRLANKAPGTFRPIESVVEDWSTLIKDFFLVRLLAEEGSKKMTRSLKLIYLYLHQDSDEDLAEVRRLVWGDGLWKKAKSLIFHTDEPQVDYLTQDEAMDAAVAYLTRAKKRAIILFDSMDEYDVGEKTFDRTIGALLRFISNFNYQYDCISIKLGLPSEIFPEVERASANPLKDLVNFDQVQWTSMELAQIAAYRYNLFLELYDHQHWKSLRHLNFYDRKHVTDFWSTFFPETHKNRYDQDEEVLTFLLRHTQLLPRQFFVILQEIAVSNARTTKSFRRFDAGCILKAVEKIELVIAGEIFRAFSHVYSNAEMIGKAVFGNFPTVFSYDELETQWRRTSRFHRVHTSTVEFEMVSFTEMLLRMGIIGIIHDNTDRYYEAEFAYNSLTPPNIGSGNDLCLHPIFSRYFNASPNAARKAILPQGVKV